MSEPTNRINITLTTNTLNIDISDKPTINISMAAGGSSVPVYKGDYVVEPDVYEDIVLPTHGKRMLEDVVTQKIPVRRIKNIAGGDTVIVGGEKYGS